MTDLSRRQFIAGAIVVGVGSSATAFSDEPALPVNWPTWRGKDSNGYAGNRGLSLTWTESSHVKWKTPIHGRGHSTPVILNGQIWLTTATHEGTEMSIMCLAADTGKVLLDKKLFENAMPDPINDLNSYASPSPAIEDGKVYFHFGTYGTACFDTKTFQQLWVRKDINCRHSVGPGSTPVLWRDLLILTFDGTDVQFQIALDKNTGVTRWKTDRSVDLSNEPGERKKSFSTPVLFEFNGKPAFFVNAAMAAYVYDPATGKELWRVKHGGYSNSCVPVIKDGMLYLSTGYDKSDLLAVKMSGQGDVTTSNIVWKYTKNVPFKPALMLVDGLLYLMGDGGVLTCLDAKTGDEVYKERIGGSYSSSPLFADGRIYVSDERGKTIVFRPGRTFEKLGENTLDDGLMASPVVTGKALILRTKSAVYRIE